MTSPTPETAHSSPTERLRRRHVWNSFNFWLVAFTAVYSLISLAALRVAILSSRMTRQSADASIATVRAWLDIPTLKFVHSLPNVPQPEAPAFSLTWKIWAEPRPNSWRLRSSLSLTINRLTNSSPVVPIQSHP
jgi:hypothetical protein